MVKRIDSSDNWSIIDTSRGFVSGQDTRLYANDAAAENLIELAEPTSNGFEPRDSANYNAAEYIYMAFADNADGPAIDRNIVRNNAGTYEINSNVTVDQTTWTAAANNDQFNALTEAVALTANQMDSSGVNAISDSEWPTMGGTFDMAMMVGGDANVETISFNYDAIASYDYLALGTDYNIDQLSSTQLEVTSLTDGNIRVKVRG